MGSLACGADQQCCVNHGRSIYATPVIRLGERYVAAQCRSVRRMVVLVNGLPAAGKSMLAHPLAMALGLPLLSKDVIKGTHADVRQLVDSGVEWCHARAWATEK